MIRIPYGQSDFRGLRKGKNFYQDRTNYIAILEDWHSKFPIFLRPRRFGKSLLVSKLHYYYGLEYKSEFETLFGDLYIGKNPTPMANGYMVLRFEFSRIDTKNYESTYKGFLDNVYSGVVVFIANYAEYFSQDQKISILAKNSPESMLKGVFDALKTNNAPYQIYLLIDEYDHFANELLSFDMPRFQAAVSANGFVRKFYESIKTATGDGIIDRLFITGVSPITMDSLTSGFNISNSISLNPKFHEMLGFSEAEVENLLVLSDIPTDSIPPMMDDLRDWYDGYRFAEEIKNHIYNTDMVLYFLMEYSVMQKYPRKMLDSNILSDYSKVEEIFKIGGDEVAKLEILQKLVLDGYVEFPLTEIFNLNKTFSQNDFLSLLFYLGMLTIEEVKFAGIRFKIPNYVIKKLYFEYFTANLLAKTVYARNQSAIESAVTSLVAEGNPAPFFNIVTEVLQENHSNRDEMAYGEKHLQTLMVGLLYPYESYMIHSEYESRRGYPDIFIESMRDRPIPFEIVLEIKYATKSQADTLPSKIEKAKKQLDGYMTSKRFARPGVRGFYVAFLGGKVKEWKEWGKY
jgi:Predicted AAA-ATPase/PD-(D/E)XK nuclease superfamily